MTSALENASLSLPEWQAVKMIFFATCQRFLFKPPFEDKKKILYFQQLLMGIGFWHDFMPSRGQYCPTFRTNFVNLQPTLPYSFFLLLALLHPFLLYYL